MKAIAIIPARYGSTRFPGKPLAILGGKPVIEWTYTAVRKVLDDVVVATDDKRIMDAVESFGGKAVLTSDSHTSGTGRVQEAVELLQPQADIVINVQGDEPFVKEAHLRSLLQCIATSNADIATLVTPFDPDGGYDNLQNPNKVKAVLDTQSCAMYFSRSVIPYVRGKEHQLWLQAAPYFMHIGVYAYHKDTLKAITSLPPTNLEQAEKLEQLRWLQNGYKIKCAVVDAPTMGIDTPEDLAKALKLIK